MGENQAGIPKATRITILTLAIVLGVLHIITGSLSLIPQINNDYHREILQYYNDFAKLVQPHFILLRSFSRASIALYSRYIISLSQLFFGILVLENGSIGKFGNYGLIFINANLSLLNVSLGTPLQRLAPIVVFMFLSIARVLIVENNTAASKPVSKTRGSSRPKTSTPKKNKNE